MEATRRITSYNVCYTKLLRVLGAEDHGKRPSGFFPVNEDFIGEGGALDWPEAVVLNRKAQAGPDVHFEGYEAVGGLRFEEVELVITSYSIHYTKLYDHQL